jgi:hypothetical protein
VAIVTEPPQCKKNRPFTEAIPQIGANLTSNGCKITNNPAETRRSRADSRNRPLRTFRPNKQSCLFCADLQKREPVARMTDSVITGSRRRIGRHDATPPTTMRIKKITTRAIRQPE